MAEQEQAATGPDPAPGRADAPFTAPPTGPTPPEEPAMSDPTAYPVDDVISTDDVPAPAPRRPDALMLVIAALTLAMAVAAFVGVVPDLSGFDPRWVLAAGAAVIGALLLTSGVRNRRRTR